MKQKIRFLLATIMMLVGATVQATTKTVTWDCSQFQPFEIYLHDGESTTKDGVTLKAIKGMAVADPNDGFMMMGINGGNSFEFSVAEGKITKIVIACSYGSSTGTGWSGFTWTGSASSVNFGDYANNVRSITFTIEDSTPAATLYNLTLADDSDAHGTVAFTVGGAAATQAQKDDVVTVSVTPAEGYSTKDVTVRAYTTWAAAPARAKSRAAAPELPLRRERCYWEDRNMPLRRERCYWEGRKQ